MGNGAPRVVHVTTVHALDDIRIYRKECTTLASAGYDVHLVAPDRGPRPSNGTVRLVSLPVTRNRLARMTFGTIKAFSVAIALRADLYHLHDPELLPAGLLLRCLGKRVIFDAHEDTPGQILSKPWLPRPVRGIVATLVAGCEWFAGHVLTGVIAATPAIARRFPEAKVKVVQNLPFRDEFEPPQDTCEPRTAFLYAGGLTKIRGLRQMVSAAGIVKRRHPECRLRLAGAFSPTDLAAEAKAWPGWEAIEYLGHLDRASLGREMARSLAGLVLFLPEPNHVNSQPNKLFEYMSARLPVIGSDFPLWRELLGSSGAGVLVDPRDPQAIADAMIWVLEHPAEAAHMGECGRKTVLGRSNWEAESKHLLEAYSRWLGPTLPTRLEPPYD